MSYKIDHDASETISAETIEWPFLKAQRDGGDPEVSTAAASDGDSTRHSSDANNGGSSSNSSHYEIVVSHNDVPSSTTNFSPATAGSHQFETCLISNAELAALANGDVKIEANDSGRIHYSASDAVHYFDPEASLASVDSEEQQRLIKVYQTAMESGDNKLITVYEIKPDDESSAFHHLDGTGSDRDVMVEIVHSPDDEQLLRSVTDDGTLVLPSSMSSTLSFVSAPTTTVAELRCTLCGFVSFARDEIAEHCQTAHDLFLCQTCNLVFKRKPSLQAHAKAKHGQTLPSIVTTSSLSTNSRSRATGRVAKRRSVATASATSLSHLTAGRRTLNTTNFEMMSDIKDILSKNKAVLPVLAHSAPSTPSGSGMASTSSGARRVGNMVRGKQGGKRASAHDWARVGSLTAQQQQQLMLDSRLSDPVTRNQFNTEFAKKITSHGIGAEVLGLSEERLPAKKGTFRLDIKERVLENGEAVPVGTLSSAAGKRGDGGMPDNVDVFYSYDIVDTKQSAPDGGCLVICGLCNFGNARIENVLFHCEIDHKQYCCHNKRCQNGFSSWDSLMRHMKTIHKKDK